MPREDSVHGVVNPREPDSEAAEAFPNRSSKKEEANQGREKVTLQNSRANTISLWCFPSNNFPTAEQREPHHQCPLPLFFCRCKL